MDVTWLEDFLAILEHRNFSRAAEQRGITQSALSRRLKALEEWVGTSLLFRTTHSMRATEPGEAFRATAEDILRRLKAGRQEALELSQNSLGELRFASTNALAFVFFPQWLKGIEAELAFAAGIQLVANHMEECERMMVTGQAHFLLCHHHPSAISRSLDEEHFRSVRVGDDVLLPVSCPKLPGGSEPMHVLPGCPDHPSSYLSYRPESGMGRIVTAARQHHLPKAWVSTAFTSHLAKLLMAMALGGRGVAWLPRSMIDENLANGELVRAADAEWDIPMEIRLFRSRHRQASAVEKLWEHVEHKTRA